MSISGKRAIGNFDLFNSTSEEEWKEEYVRVMEEKYSRYSRNFSKAINGEAYPMKGAKELPPIFVVPRIRAGPSYKSIPLRGVTSEQAYYAPISKGFGMQEVSSFSLGPIVGEGLCLVNAAFSKSITIHHIEGGGVVDYKRKNFWRPSRQPHRDITFIDSKYMLVDGVKVEIFKWLKKNEHLWLKEWEKWRKSIALCSRGDFHWADASETVAYRYGGSPQGEVLGSQREVLGSPREVYLNFVDWKRECYIKPSYKLLPNTEVIQFLNKVWKEHKRPLALLHPKGIDEEVCQPLTKEGISEMFESEVEMCCQPYVIAGFLLGVSKLTRGDSLFD